MVVVLASFFSLVSCFSEPPSIAARSRIDLGRKIFHDARLSAHNDVSCSSCHLPEYFFSDARPVSIGSGGLSGTRNSPSLLETGKATSFFWDGREASLGDAVLQPFTNPVEMGLADMAQLATRLAAQPEYAALFNREGGVPQLDRERLASALVAYIGSLPGPDGPAFRHLTQGAILDEEALVGMTLFNGKAECGTCHLFNRGNTTLTDNRSHHTGIGFEQVAGNIASSVASLDDILASRPLGHTILADKHISELGSFTSSRRANDIGAFKTPSLRNVARTAPYMHDGSVPTLEEALEREIYYRNLSRGTPIQLTVREKQSLLAFLRALSDTSAP